MEGGIPLWKVRRVKPPPARSLPQARKKAVSVEAFVFLGVFILIFGLIGHKMGMINLLNTMMNTAFDLLINTVLYIMGIAVLAGALGAMLTEFGVVALINKLLSPLMGVLYGLPGAASVGIVTTYLSDNPAILTLADDPSFRRYFKRYQLPCSHQSGHSLRYGRSHHRLHAGPAADLRRRQLRPGGPGRQPGSCVRKHRQRPADAALHQKVFGTEAYCDIPEGCEHADLSTRSVRPGGFGARLLAALTEGGASGVKMGVEIIPGVLLICTFVLLLTKGPGGARRLHRRSL